MDAERMIAHLKLKHPERAASIDAAFLDCRPRMRMPRRLYLAHVREICLRVKNRHEPTLAECVNVLSEVSFKFPLRQDWFAAYVIGFERLFPRSARRILEDGLLTEWNREEGAKHLALIRDKLRRQFGNKSLPRCEEQAE